MAARGGGRFSGSPRPHLRVAAAFSSCSRTSSGNPSRSSIAAGRSGEPCDVPPSKAGVGHGERAPSIGAGDAGPGALVARPCATACSMFSRCLCSCGSMTSAAVAAGRPARLPWPRFRWDAMAHLASLPLFARACTRAGASNSSCGCSRSRSGTPSISTARGIGSGMYIPPSPPPRPIRVPLAWGPLWGGRASGRVTDWKG